MAKRVRVKKENGVKSKYYRSGGLKKTVTDDSRTKYNKDGSVKKRETLDSTYKKRKSGKKVVTTYGEGESYVQKTSSKDGKRTEKLKTRDATGRITTALYGDRAKKRNKRNKKRITYSTK